MNLSKMGLRLLVVLGIAAILAGCGSPTPETPTAAPTQPPQPTLNLQPTLLAVQTQAVQTYVANVALQTQNAPTATRVPPTATLAPTATRAITATPQGTVQATVAKATATATLPPRPAGATVTPSVHCTIKSAYPTAANTISPGADFTARWTIVNTGAETWTTQYTLAYSSGARFAKQKTQNLPFTVGPKADITLTLDLTAASSAGTYNAVWTILNGYQPVCVMGLSVVVK